MQQPTRPPGDRDPRREGGEPPPLRPMPRMLSWVFVAVTLMVVFLVLREIRLGSRARTLSVGQFREVVKENKILKLRWVGDSFEGLLYFRGLVARYIPR